MDKKIFTIGQGHHFGIAVRLATGSDGKNYLTAVIWYPRAWKRLGYLYPSIRWF